jgi:hypothetical protein
MHDPQRLKPTTLALSASGSSKTYQSPAAVSRSAAAWTSTSSVAQFWQSWASRARGRARCLTFSERSTRGLGNARHRWAARGWHGRGEPGAAQSSPHRFVFQFPTICCPEFTAEENVMMPLLIAGDSETCGARPGAGVTRGGRPRASDGNIAGRALRLRSATRSRLARALVTETGARCSPTSRRETRSRCAGHLQDLIASLAREKHQTFVIVTHNDRLASLADRILRLESATAAAGFLRAPS